MTETSQTPPVGVSDETPCYAQWPRWYVVMQESYLDRAFYKGRDDYRSGKPFKPNPYRLGCPKAASEWASGWMSTKSTDKTVRQMNGYTVLDQQPKERP